MADRSIPTTILVVLVVLASLAPIGNGWGEVDNGPSSRWWVKDPLVREMIERTTANMTEEFVLSALENLTAFGTRYTHSVQNPKAAQWLYEQFEGYGYKVSKWNFSHQMNDRLSNVIAEHPGTDPDGYIVVCAHFDSVNWPESWDYPESPAPGADDDGTGVAIVLQIAKLLQRYSFKQDIKFMFFNAEELTRAVGSTRYVENASANGDDILAVLNVDMVGYNYKYIKQDIIYQVPSHYIYTDHIFPVNMEYGFIDHLYDKEDPQSASSWGDVEPFWEKGYDGVAFAESLYPRTDDPYYDANPNYHTENDTIDTVNIELTNRVGMLVAGTLISMAGPTLPDVGVSQVSLPEGLVFEDELMDVVVTVDNSGNLDAVDLEVDLSIDSSEGETKVVDIPLGGTGNVTFSWKAVPGDHVFNITLDPSDAFGEWDETDNRYSVSKFVQVRPDIELARFEVLEDEISQGETTHLTVKAINHGPTDIESNLTIRDNREPGEVFATEFLQLDPGEEWEKVYEWSSIRNGTHVLTGTLSQFVPYDRNGTNNEASDSIAINGIPVARFFINPRTGAKTYQDVLFLADASVDDDYVTSFFFDFGDGNDTDWTTQPSVSHNYTQDGVYVASLKVRDGQGAVSKVVQMDLSIENRPPVVKIEADRYIVETGAPISFSAAGTYDLDGKVVSYNWTFSPGPIYSSKASPTVRFMEMGTVTARLMVTDDDGAMASGSITVDITNKAPVASIEGPRTVRMGETVQFFGQGSEDEDGRITKYYWTFGDGTFSSEQDPLHAFSVAGNFTVELTVTDNHGGMDKTTLKVVVTERPVKDAIELEVSDYYPLIGFLVLIGVYVGADLSRSKGPPRKKGRRVARTRKGAKRKG